LSLPFVLFQVVSPKQWTAWVYLINHFKWQVPKNEQLEPFQKCHPQYVWFRDVTNQLTRYQFQPTNNLYLPHIKW